MKRGDWNVILIWVGVLIFLFVVWFACVRGAILVTG